LHVRLTGYTDYCLRVLIYLAVHPERRVTIAEIARSYGISENHLVKVAHELGKTGFLENTRGRGGGLALALSPEHINVGLVVRSAEGPTLPAACFDATAPRCAIARMCTLRGALGEAVDAFYGVLDRYTLADLVGKGPRQRQLRAQLIASSATARA
jgi:Rrf2 family transcriptional regulator, nitric oxide-sensitive transcriptional repressor